MFEGDAHYTDLSPVAACDHMWLTDTLGENSLNQAHVIDLVKLVVVWRGVRARELQHDGLIASKQVCENIVYVEPYTRIVILEWKSSAENLREAGLFSLEA